MRIDAHQHFWALARGDYGWITPDLGPLYRDFGPADLWPELDAAGIDGTILVQAAPTEAETEYMLGLMEAAGVVRGVVGWVDFEAVGAADRIAARGNDRRIVGLRPMIQDIADPDWILGSRLDRAFDAVAAAGLTFDALVLPHHLPRLLERLQRQPGLRCVIDHAAKPDIARGDVGQWRADIARLASQTDAYCKLSGLVTEADEEWTIDDLRPEVDHLLDTFGAERLIWGSDWPVCRLRASYAEWVEITDSLLADLAQAERAAVMGETARRAYRLGG